jgi:hypothetical protein
MVRTDADEGGDHGEEPGDEHEDETIQLFVDLPD